MNLLVIWQDNSDNIYYISSQDKDKEKVLEYTKFLEFLSFYPIQNNEDFNKELNSFKVLLLDLEVGTWEILDNSQHYSSYSFHDLYELNKKEEIEEGEETSLDKYKKIIDNKLKKANVKNNII